MTDDHHQQPTTDGPRDAGEVSYRRIVELASEGIWTLDADDRTTFVNPALAAMLGYTVDEMLGRPLYDFMDAGSGLIAAEKLKRRRAGVTERHRQRLLHKDGREVWIVSNAAPIHDDDGAYRGALAVVTDITEHRVTEARSRALVHRSSDITTIVEPDGSWRWSSAAATRVLGYPEDFDLEAGIFSLLHPDDIAPAVEAFDEVVRGRRGPDDPIVLRVQAADGTWRHLETVASNLVDDEAVNGIVLNSRDISERVRVEDELRASEQRFRTVVQNASDMVSIADVDGNITYTSPSVERVLGYAPDELVGTQTRDLIHPDDVDRVEQTVGEQFMAGQREEAIEYRVRHRNGTWRLVEGLITNMLDEPNIHGIIATNRDITERHAAERKAAQLTEVLEQSNEVVVLSEPSGTIVYANRRAREFFGLEGADHVGELSAIESRERLRSEIMPFVRRHGLWTGELAFRTTQDDEVPMIATLQAHRESNEIVLVSTIAHDITELKRTQHRLHHEATHDSLTGLPNRVLFSEGAEQALARAVRQGATTAVMFLDLDGFKAVNDSLGHEAGDRMLVEIARRLRVAVRAGDLVARIGGDEFCVLCESVSGAAEMRELGQRLIDAVSIPLQLEGREAQIGTSIGVALDKGGTQAIGSLLRDADVALYRAKHDGGGRVELFSPPLPFSADPASPGR